MRRKLIYLYAAEDGSINYMNPDTQNNNKFGNNNNKIKTTVKYVLYAYK